MRLDNAQRIALKLAFKNLNAGDEAFLFGSRVDDDKKGGDIDLLIYSQQPSFKLSRQLSQSFFKYCEEKIDIIVIDPAKITKEQSVFVQSIQKQRLVDL